MSAPRPASTVAPRRRGALLWPLLLVAGCAALRGDRELERARWVVQQAEALALAGDPAAAVERIRADLADVAAGSEEDFLRAFTLGWVHGLWAEQDAGSAGVHLAQAVDWYGQALELRPGHLPASQNLAAIHARRAEVQGDAGPYLESIRVLEDACAQGSPTEEQRYALRVDVASLHATRGDLEQALQDLETAYALAPEQAAAPWMMVELLSERDQDRPRLHRWCQQFATSPATWAPAQAGFARLVHGRGLRAAASLEAWLDLAARRGTLAREGVADLPGPRPEPGRTELDRALAGLQALVEDPLGLEPDHWVGSASRRQLLARALRSLAEANPDPGWAAQALQRAYELAPAAADSVAQGLPELRLDLALDLAFVYHGSAEQVDPDHARFKGLFQDDGWLSLGTYRSVDRPLEQRTKYLSTLGIMFQERGIWGDDPEDLRLAVRYLRAAIDLDPEPRPSLSRKLGDVLALQGKAVAAMDAWYAAAEGFLDHGAIRFARDVLPVADPFATGTRRTLRHQQQALEDLLYPRHGPYLGLSGGLTDGHESGSRLEGDLQDGGHSTRVSINDSEFGWKAFVGYRPEQELPLFGRHYQLPWAAELGYVSLEGHSSRIRILSTPNVADLRAAIEDDHPLTGRGVSLAATVFPWERGDFSATAKVGGWWWRSDLDVRLAGGNVRVDEAGLDYLLGVGAWYRLTWKTSARLEVERYFLDGDPVDLFSLGLQLRF